jgi:membrane protein implicated in regulation of membrane protease activity
MEWWAWILLGFVLLVLEMVTPGGFYFVFFGAGALLVGLLALVDVTATDWVEWLLFSVFSIGATLVFRKPLMERFGANIPGRDIDNLVGETALALEGIAPGAVGKAELRGTSWTACNAGGESVQKGQRCKVERVDGLTLFIRPAGAGGTAN